jgi:hypothetical protein
MRNLYSITKGQQAIRDLAGAMRDLTGNMPMLPGVFPDYSAPIVRTAGDGVRELTMSHWGIPSPTFAIAGKKTDSGVTNICNVKSPTGGDGSASKVGASSRLRAFPRMRFYRTVPGRRYGSRSTKAGRSPFLRGSGRVGPRFARSRRAKRRMTFSAS